VRSAIYKLILKTEVRFLEEVKSLGSKRVLVEQDMDQQDLLSGLVEE
jgi:hypothetical protein